MSLTEATAAILADGFTVGTTTGPTTGLVVDQAPNKGLKRPFGTPIDLTFEDPPTSITCP